MSILEILEAHDDYGFDPVGDSMRQVCMCGTDCGQATRNPDGVHRAHVAQVLEQHEREAKAEALEEAAESLNPELINYRRDAMEVLSQRIQPAGGNDTLSLQLALVAAKRSREWLHNRAAQLKETP